MYVGASIGAAGACKWWLTLAEFFNRMNLVNWQLALRSIAVISQR